MSTRPPIHLPLLRLDQTPFLIINVTYYFYLVIGPDVPTIKQRQRKLYISKKA